MSVNGVAPVSVYVLDDDAEVLEALVGLIDAETGFTVVGSSMSGGAAVQEIRSRRPAVAVIDADADGFDGIDVCRRIAELAPEVACVLVTAGIGSRWIESEMEAAAMSAVVLKRLIDFPLLEVIAEVAGDRSERDQHR